jgi:hypothetical protein
MRGVLIVVLVVGAVAAKYPGQTVSWDVAYGASNPYSYYWPFLGNLASGSPIGDLNGDGIQEIVCALYQIILDGATGGVFRDGLTGQWGVWTGVGDFDGDGFDDYSEYSGIAGCPTPCWRIVSGPTGAPLTGTFPGEANDVPRAVGDVNGDGYDDFGQVSYVGVVYGWVDVYLGPSMTYYGTVSGLLPLRNWGQTLQAVGDVTGDGHDDFLVGGDGIWWASAPPGGVGYVSLISGADLSHVFQWYGTWTHERFGRSLHALGDLDGDGVPDFAIGSKFNTRIVSGGTFADLYATTNGNSVVGAMPAVYGVGDVDRDGSADYVGRRFGEAELTIFSGRTREETWAFGWPFPLQPGAVSGFPMAQIPVGDIDGDGYTDVVCGLETGVSAPPTEPRRLTAFSLRPLGVTDYGVRCAGAGPGADEGPSIGLSGKPRIGANGTLNLSGAPPGSSSYLLIGVSDATYAGLSLPLDLGAYGAAGCSLLASIDWTAAFEASPPGALEGSVVFGLGIPSTSSLVGATVFAQWLVVEDSNFVVPWLAATSGLKIEIQP